MEAIQNPKIKAEYCFHEIMKLSLLIIGVKRKKILIELYEKREHI